MDEALTVCFRQLGRRDQTEAELRRRLAGEGVDEATIDQALDELRERRYVDDAVYARRFAEDRRALDGWGPERIRTRLEQVGVDDELIERALGVRDAADELQAAIAVLERRMTEGGPVDDRARKRAVGLLLRRGYDSELAFTAVRRYFELR
ncbi:MAG: regulatory protein [Solirubrobacteraceae bacterium]|nr:regulatory protein [Solirubrobacteraceae bacterium]